MKSRLDWDKLPVFYAVAKAGSLTHAAHKLSVSQSAISRKITALEKEIGTTLFHRHARGLVLTQAGETLFKTTKEILFKLEGTRLRLSDDHAKPQGGLRVTTTIGFGTEWIMKKIPQFCTLYPKIQLELIFDNEELDLVMREVDCALRFYQPLQPDLIQKYLFTVDMHFYASKNYLAQHGKPQTIKDLTQHPLIVFGGHTPSSLEKLNWGACLVKQHAPDWKPFLQINNLLAIKDAVKQDLGIAFLPDYLVDRDGPLERILEKECKPPSFDIFFCYPSAVKNLAKLHVFRDFIFEQSRKWQF